MLCVSGVEKRERPVSGLEAQGRLCGEGDSGMGPLGYLCSGTTGTKRNTFI